MITRLSYIYLVLVCILGFTLDAAAQTPAPQAQDLMPNVTVGEMKGSETHPPLRLTHDKSELVPLDRDAASVIIGNPAHIGIALDTPNLAVIIPRQAGATHFSILDREGKVVMQRHVLVGSPKKNYVRVRRSCGNAAEESNCQPTSVYFCPDMCHEIQPSAEDGKTAQPTAP